MGQYWKPVNLTKREFINPPFLGAGMKLGEQVETYPGTGAALLILTAAMPERRGGGDLDLDSNYYGPERTAEHSGSAPIDEEYNEVARRTIGRWAGDQIAIVGDYAEDSDLPKQFKASKIYSQCDEEQPGSYTDISADVARVIEHECSGKFSGDGWRDFTPVARR